MCLYKHPADVAYAGVRMKFVDHEPEHARGLFLEGLKRRSAALPGRIITVKWTDSQGRDREMHMYNGELREIIRIDGEWMRYEAV